jgi:endoglucanase
MKNFSLKIFTFIICVSISFQGMAQIKGYRLDFNNNTWTPAYSHQDYILQNQNQLLRISANAVGSNYQNFVGSLPNLDISASPQVYVKIKTQNALKFELRILDNNGNETNNNNPTVNVVAQAGFSWITFDFKNKFSQSWPSAAVVNAAMISKFSVLVNSGGNPNYTGWLEIDEIIFGDSTQIVTTIDPVVYQPKINQLGFLTGSMKIAIIPTTRAVPFTIIDASSGDSIFRGITNVPKQWSNSQEMVAQADFSSLKIPGKYKLYVKGLKISYPFIINDSTYDGLIKASSKAFYYQRASTNIPAAYGGIYARAAGHQDTQVLVHGSAASSSRPGGTILSCPKGWYDAGDYNKYVVPAGIATWQLLSSQEYFNRSGKLPAALIPESGNSIPDLLDEALWEILWLRSMQDPNDGGVYHKLTNANFDGTIMPEFATTTRYVVQKSTPATLNFAAVLAKASRLYKNYPELNAHFSDSCLAQAEAAWDWAVLNPSAQYDQAGMNKLFTPQIVTGDYGLQSYNVAWGDEWLWAAVELYIATGKTKYLNKISLDNVIQQVPSWANVQYLGLIAMIEAENNFPPSVASQAKNLLLQLSQTLVDGFHQSAYTTAMGTLPSDYEWNSNGTAANQAGILLHAYLLTKDLNYFNAASSNINYLLGMNPLNYCFVTGFGSHSPEFPHQRLSAADGVQEPIPGFLVNGPHNDYVKECFYTSTIPAFTYVDNYCSSATNEIGIYDNSALLYALAGLKQAYQTVLVSGIMEKKEGEASIKVFPNPNNGRFELMLPAGYEAGKWQLIDINGRLKEEGEVQNRIQIPIDLKMTSGIYILRLLNKNIQALQRVVIFE